MDHMIFDTTYVDDSIEREIKRIALACDFENHNDLESSSNDSIVAGRLLNAYRHLNKGDTSILHQLLNEGNDANR